LLLPSVRLGAEETNLSTASNAIDWDKECQFWSFKVPRNQARPVVKNLKWPRQPLDYFILARLVKRKISPPSEAERRILIRRLTLDLTGLEQQLHACQITSGERRHDRHAVDQLVTNIKNARLSPAEQREQLDLLVFKQVAPENARTNSHT